MRHRRVVVTGLGVFSPAGYDINTVWQSVVSGQSWITANTKFDVSDAKSKVCAQISSEVFLDPVIQNISTAKERRRAGTFINYGIIASHFALADAKIDDIFLQANGENFATYVTSGIGGVDTMEDNIKSMIVNGSRKISPFCLPSILINLLPGHIAIKFGLKGPSFSHVSACASSGNAIGEAFKCIRNGDFDICLAGGSEAAICQIGIGSFDAMNALSTNYNDVPNKASRPLDKHRDGFVMGEGAAILVLEEREHALKRGAKIYAEITGYGASCDAHHITSPDENGASAIKAMQKAMEMAKLLPKNIDYINMHGTSTPVGDIIELKSIGSVFLETNPHIAISSTKSVTGHLLGAASAIEAIFAIQTITTGIIPPNINLDDPEEECQKFNIITKATKADVKHVLSNSFGFGGANATLIFSKYIE